MTNELAETTVQRDEWKRIAEDRGIELERLRADISQAYDLRDKAEGRYCTALGAIEQLHAAVKTAQELAATRLMEIERLSKREKTLMDVIDSRDRALGFVPLDDALHPGPSISKAFANSPRRVSDEPGAGGIKCTHCNGNGTKLQVFDAELFDGWSPEDEPCETCNGAGRITTVEQYLKTLPADWHQDSSVETWFPMLNEEVERLRRAEKSCMEHHISQGASRDASSGEG